MRSMYFSGNAKSIKDIREAIGSSEAHHKDLNDSLKAPVDLLKGQMHRLYLKEKKFQTFEAATHEDVDKMWEHCNKLDSQLKVVFFFLHCLILLITSC